MRRPETFLPGLLALTLACSGPATAPQGDAALAGVVDELSRAYFEELPEIASYYGVPSDLAPGAGARLTDRSPEAESARRARMEALVSSLQEVASTGLDAGERVTRDTLVTLFEGALGPARIVDYGTAFGEYGVWFLPYAINHNSGPTIAVPSLLEAQHSVASADDAEDYLTRLALYGPTLDGTLEKLRHDVGLGAIPPDFVVDKTIAVLAGFVATPPRENVLYLSFVKKLERAEIAGADALAGRALALIESEVLPAGRRAHDYLASIRDDAPHDAGIWRLPDGPALYRAMIRHMTDTDLPAEEIHELGLAEVARITAEMDALLVAEGYTEGSVGERFVVLGDEERFRYPNTEEGKAAILADITKQLAAVDARVPEWFGTLPEYDVEVRAVPEFSQDTAPGGYYDAPALDGSRPGIYWINLRDTAIWPKFSVPTLTYHEAVPGHHFQVALALDQDVPLIRSIFFSNPTGEGWALYAEALAEEMGLYEDDPFGDLGRLQAELHRAIRLVVDTGMHAMKWSRERAIDYMVSTEGIDLSEATSEIDRYAVWPGQALGYKLGMLKLQELRAEAERERGEGFDIREFHDQVLRVSSAALPVIESEMRAWIDARR